MASSRALTRAHTVMNLLSPRVAAPFSVHSLSSATLPTNGSDSNFDFGSSDNESKVDVHSKQCPNGEVCPLVNRFMKEGSLIPFKVMEDKEGMYAKLDMPGIGKKGVKVWVEDDSLHVTGEEEEGKGSPLLEECRRKYYGHINITQSCYKLEEIAAELNDGVLKVKIPKRKDIINVNVDSPSCSETHLNDALPLLIFGLCLVS